MKRSFTLLFCLSILLASCSREGPQGPPGPPGPPGDGGDAYLAQVLDFENVTFNEGNDYSFEVDFDQQGIEVFESDAVLVYIKTGEDGTADGLPVEIFRMLPQTYYINGEALQFNFDFTFFDVLVFLDGTVDFGNLDNSYTQNRVLRVVVVPAEFATTGVNMADMKAVLNELDIKEQDIKKASIAQ